MSQKTHISILQEHCVKVHLPMPKYEFISIPGTAQSVGQFKCYVVIDQDNKAEGLATSKQVAKQEAAKNMLEKLDIQTATVEAGPGDFTVHINAVGELNEFSSKNGLSYPNYKEYTNNKGQYVVECDHFGKTTSGVDIKKKQAKQKAANAMLQSHLQGNVLSLKNSLPVKVEPSLISPTSTHLDSIAKQEYKRITSSQERTRSSISSSRVSSTTLMDSKINPSIIVSNEALKTLADAITNLKISYNITIIQEEPCILAVKFMLPNGCSDTIFDKGRDSVEALQKVFNQGLKIYSKTLNH